MIACVDVYYRGDAGVAACVVIREWQDREAVEEKVCTLPVHEPYASGEFFRRELSPLLFILAALKLRPHFVVIDGYVWLDSRGRPGLGAHLHRALGGTCAVIGVAKRRFGDAEFAVPLLRGYSHRALYVTSAGIEPQIAASYIAAMHGKYRIPTMLRRVDHLCRHDTWVPFSVTPNETAAREQHGPNRA
ncbi:MAG: endonuclease V [Kiritimatiellae bacterium]|nr:endonuclease V [Kiritimatiellia bacterium]